jgi:hypothetical protein
MIFEELQQAIKDKKVDIIPPGDIPESDNPIDKMSVPSFDEFLNTLIHLRTIRLGRLSIVKLPSAASVITAHFKPTRFLTIRIFITGKSASTPVVMQFNSDIGTNYIYNVTANNPSSDSINLDNASSSDDIFTVAEIENTGDREKLVLYKSVRYTGSAAGSALRVDGVGVWENRTTQITSIQLTPTAGGGTTFGAGSFIEVFGHD